MKLVMEQATTNYLNVYVMIFIIKIEYQYNIICNIIVSMCIVLLKILIIHLKILIKALNNNI